MGQLNSLNLASYKGKQDGDYLPASQWNGLLASIENAVNEVVSAVNNGTGNSGSGSASNAPSVDTGNTLKVNGAAATISNGVVTLAASDTGGAPTRYVLSGTLHGRVVIGNGETIPADHTEVVLDGAIIINTTDYPALDYAAEKKTLYVTLAKNSANYIANKYVADKADGQKGAINSESGLVIQGTGKLAVLNYGGHGVKSKDETRITGKPQIYVGAIHDGIHGNKGLTITDGKFYITGANNHPVNDAFAVSKYDSTDSAVIGGTAAVDDAKGPLLVMGGEFYAYNLDGDVFDAANADAYNQHRSGFLSPKREYSIYTDNSSGHISTGMKEWTLEEYFGGAVRDTVNGGWSTSPSGKVLACTVIGTPDNENSPIALTNEDGSKNVVAYGAGSSEGAPGADEVVLASTIPANIFHEYVYGDSGIGEEKITYDAYYIIPANKHALVQGFVKGHIKIATQKSTITLSDACVYNPYGAAVDYANSSKRLQIQVAENEDGVRTIGYIISDAADAAALNSENNIEYEIKNGSVLYIKNTNGDGVRCSEYKVNNATGDTIIRGCGKCGVVCSQFDFCDKINDGNALQHGAVIITENKGIADVYVRKSGKGAKGTMGTSIGTPGNIASARVNAGTLSIGTIASETYIDFSNEDNIVKHIGYEKVLGVVANNKGTTKFNTDWVFNPGVEVL